MDIRELGLIALPLLTLGCGEGLTEGQQERLDDFTNREEVGQEWLAACAGMRRMCLEGMQWDTTWLDAMEDRAEDLINTQTSNSGPVDWECPHPHTNRPVVMQPRGMSWSSGEQRWE
jgi:hypothetical protein